MVQSFIGVEMSQATHVWTWCERGAVVYARENTHDIVLFCNLPGYQTGKCVPADRGNTSVHVCEIYGWCPVEIDETPMPGFHLR